MPTIHNAAQVGDIAESILLPGDPLRAKYIAENFLEDAMQFNSIRNMYGYTGTYKGKRVSVMATGMGVASIGIYVHELIHEYGVKNLIRIGSAGTLDDSVADVGDIIMAAGSCTDTNYAVKYELPGPFSAIASFDLLSKAVDAAKENNIRYAVGNTLCTDHFYTDIPNWRRIWAKMGVIGEDMETYALYCEAATAKVNALAMFTVTTNRFKGVEMDAQQREQGLKEMMTVALEAAIR